MSQTVEQPPIVENSGQWCAKEQVDDNQGSGGGKRETTKDGDASDTGTPSSAGRPFMQRLVVVSMAVSLEKVRGLAGNNATNEIIELLHNDNFNLEMFRTMVKSSCDCKRITKDVIEQCKSM